MMQALLKCLYGFSLLLFCFTSSYGAQFSLPPSNEALVGKVKYISVPATKPSTVIAEKYDLGINALLSANPVLTEPVFSQEKNITLPTQFLLPPVPREGIIINLAEMRLYYFPKESNTVMSFPIAIGRIGKTIPITNTKVIRKVINPDWVPTPSEIKFNADQGIKLPHVVHAGPDNPLGPYAVYLGLPTYLIHTTLFPESIGTRSSFGCIRMYENDIRSIFPSIQRGLPVTIIDMPNKIAWNDEVLYLESHPPLEENSNNKDDLMNSIADKLFLHHTTFVNWELVSYLSKKPDGVPHAIGIMLN